MRDVGVGGVEPPPQPNPANTLVKIWTLTDKITLTPHLILDHWCTGKIYSVHYNNKHGTFLYIQDGLEAGWRIYCASVFFNLFF